MLKTVDAEEYLDRRFLTRWHDTKRGEKAEWEKKAGIS